MIKQKRYLLIGLLICSLVLASLSAPFSSHAFAADEKTQASGDNAYYGGHECVPGQVIIIYDDNVQAKQSADMIINGSASYQVTERFDDDQTDGDDEKPADEDTDDDEQGNSNSDKEKQENANAMMAQATVIDSDENIVVVEVDADVSMADYIAEAMSQPGVQHAQPNYVYTIDATVDDPIANNNTDGYGWYLHAVNAFSAWDYTFGDPSVIIGVIDTGLDADHQDFSAGNITYEDMADDGEPGFADDDSADTALWHGTMVAGFIGATANNNEGSSGLAPECSVIVVDAFVGNSTSTAYIIAAIDFLMASDVKVINMSFGGAGTNDGALADKILQAYDAGIVMVASAGNDSVDTEVSPSDQECVISVMASTFADDYLWTSSNFGTAKDITAPGVAMRTATSNGGYATGSGTSFAAPMVSAAAALILSMDATLTPEEVAQILYASADDTAKTREIDGAEAQEYGAGRLNVYEALSYMLRVTGISISPGDALLVHDETLQLLTTITPDNAENTTVYYASSDENIATVDVDGLIRANSANNGTAIITATSDDGGHTDTCTVTVVETKVTAVALTPESDHIDVGETLALTAEVLPSGATNQDVIYSSSDEAIATVDASGLVTGIAIGDAIITVTTDESAFTDTCALEVGYPVEAIALVDGNVEIGATLQLVPDFTPTNATNQNVTYISSNLDAATVEADGLVTGIALGTTTITVTTQEGGYEAECTVVSGHYVQSVELTPDTMEIDVGDNDQVTATITPSNATNQDVTYASGNEAVAIVDAVGVVWAQSVGTTQITVTTDDGEKTDMTVVEVVQPPQEVLLYPTDYNMLIAETIQLETVVLPENAAHKEVTYLSGDTAIATVDANGLVTAHSNGDTVITVTTSANGLTDTCDIHVVDEIITSSVYTVNRLEKYLEDVAIETTVQQIIDAIDNVLGVIRIYNNAMEEVTEGLVSTGYYVQLEIGGVVVDEVRILIEGDCNPDTILDIIDYTLIRLHILDVAKLSGMMLEVADVNDDGVIDIIDYTLVRLHILDVLGLY